MKRLRSNSISLLCTLAIAMPLIACGHPRVYHHHEGGVFDDGRIRLKNGSVLIKVKGQDTAHVDGEGRLRIGDEAVALTPAGQAALQRYNGLAQGLRDEAVELGTQSADYALHTLGAVFGGLMHGTADQAGREAERGGEAIEARARALCQDLQALKLAQDAAAEAAPRFRPYAVIGEDQVHDCAAEDGRGDNRQFAS
jgi:hypothetical protein